MPLDDDEICKKYSEYANFVRFLPGSIVPVRRLSEKKQYFVCVKRTELHPRGTLCWLNSRNEKIYTQAP